MGLRTERLGLRDAVLAATEDTVDRFDPPVDWLVTERPPLCRVLARPRPRLALPRAIVFHCKLFEGRDLRLLIYQRLYQNYRAQRARP